MSVKHLGLWAIVALLSLGLSGCDKKTSSPATKKGGDKSSNRTPGPKKPHLSRRRSQKPPEDRVFRWGSNFPRYIDPNRVTETPGNYLAQNMWECLYNHALGTGPPVPGVATQHKISADGKTWTFTLRKNARWSNGRTVTAKDFVYSWKRALSPSFISENVELLWQFIDGAKAYKLGKNKDWSSVGIKAIDDYTLQVRLKNPTPFFNYLVAYIAYAPVPREAIEKHGNKWTRPENLVVNGPYTIISYKERDRIVLVQNKKYWDRKSLKIKRWEFVHVERETQAVKMYNLGQVHYISDLIPPELVPKLKAQNRKDFNIDPLLCTYYIKFNTQKKPFNDVRVRRAFNLAINKDELTTNLLQMGQIPATNFMPRMFKKTHKYKSPRGAYFNPSKAKKLLADAGYSGSNFPKVTLIFNSAELHQKIANFYQGQLRKHLGVQIDLSKMEWKSLLAKLHQKDFTLSRSGWCADYPDPAAFLMVYHSLSENNDPGYKSPQFDALLKNIQQEGDTKKRNAFMYQAEKMLMRDLPSMPLYHYSRVYLLKPFIGGMKPHVMDYHLIKYVYFRE